MNSLQSRFDFLRQNFSALADFGRHAEQYCDSDPFSCMANLGGLSECIVNEIFFRRKLPRPDGDTPMMVRIDTLYQRRYLPDAIYDILHELRKARNEALHCFFSSADTCRRLLPKAVTLCEWFVESYEWASQQSDVSLNHLGEYMDLDHIMVVRNADAEPAPQDLQPAADTAGDDLAFLKQLPAKGAAIPAPHALRNMLNELSSSPQLCQWIRKCIRTGTVNEQSYRKLQNLYRTRTMA